jgi:hypothetical protein
VSHEHVIDLSIVENELTPQDPFYGKSASLVETLRRGIGRQNSKGDAPSTPRGNLVDRGLHEGLSHTVTPISLIHGDAVDLPHVGIRDQWSGPTKLDVTHDVDLVCSDQHVSGIKVFKEWNYLAADWRWRVVARPRQSINFVQSAPISCCSCSNARHRIMLP